MYIYIPRASKEDHGPPLIPHDRGMVRPDDDDDTYLKKITTRVSQNLILHRNADQPNA
jgi:hypothetical protein